MSDTLRKVVVRPITRDEALALVRGYTEKPDGTDPALHVSTQHQLHYALLPLDAFADNNAGERYDGTVNLERAENYAARTTSDFPPVIAGTRFPTSKLNIIDGGHRLTGARLRGDATIATVFKVPVGHPLCPPPPVVEFDEEPQPETSTQAPS